MNLKLHPQYGFARVVYLGEHAMDWALDKIGSPAHESSGEEDLLAAAGIGTIVRRGKVRSYALRLNELIIHNNRTWFGEGDIRLDALVVQGSGSKSKSDFYHPSTFSFPRVADGEALSIGQPGLLLYYGQPRYFLDLFLLVSRDSGNSEKLVDLLKQNVTAKELDHAVTPLLQLAMSAKLRTDLESAVLEIDDKNRHGLSSRGEKVLRDFGREIFRSVFVNAPTIQDIYARSKGAAKDLRIKLRIESAELAGLPWEYLYEESEMPSFVSLRLPIVRYLETAGKAGQMGVKGPLRILGMIADPASGDWPKLDVVKERDRINKGTDRLQREGLVDFQWVPGGTGKDLMNKLLEGEWHVFHFIGHGGVEEFDSNGGRAVSTKATASP